MFQCSMGSAAWPSCVLIHHLLWANSSTGNRVLNIVSALRRSTWVGVDLFFVLSGFLITGILFDSLSDKRYFRNFYARRFLRIFPLYYGFLLLLLIFTKPLHLHWNGMQWMLLLYLQNTGWVTPLIHYNPSPSFNLNHFWSLAVEEQFYLLWPLIVFWIKDLRKLIVTTLVLSAAALMMRIVLLQHGVGYEFVFAFTACRADTLLLGGCLALLVRSRWREQVTRWAPHVLLASFAVLVPIALHRGSLEWKNSFFISTFGYSIIAIAGAALIAQTLRERSWLHHVFEQGSLRFLGKYSYGIYIFHYSIDASYTARLRRVILGVYHSKGLAVLGGALIVAAITIVLAVISFKLYEEPFLKLKKHFDGSRSAQPGSPMVNNSRQRKHAAA